MNGLKKLLQYWFKVITIATINCRWLQPTELGMKNKTNWL
jgi:hypothetical protein